MKFTGQIRVPEVDHPGVPATFVVDDNQAEVVLEGESLGRWSLFDVHVTRLVSSAFQVDLAGEEITFLADEPVDFAYKGVEHMAEAWARYKTMTVPRRVVAVKRSRKGTTPSRIKEFQNAMVENLRREQSGEPIALPGEDAQPPVAVPPGGPFIEAVAENPETQAVQDPVIPLVTDSDDAGGAGSPPEDERMAAERKALAEERAVLEEQRRALEEALARAESLEKERLEAAQVDIDRIESEKRVLEGRHENDRIEAERLEAERRELQQLEADRVEHQRQQEKALEKQKRIDAERLDNEREELARLDAERMDRERLEAERLEAARLEMERLEEERLELDRLESVRLEREQAEVVRVEKARLAGEEREARLVAREEAAEAATEAANSVVKPTVLSDDEPVGRVAEVLGTSAEGDLPENAKELIVDLGAFEQRDAEESAPSRRGPEPEPVLAGVPEKAGIMGAVKAAFGRNGKNHVHDFTEAPGGIGMVRYICRECGYVSISSSD